jgi:DNA invertase Pin-like site-specific DNA recombinase
MTPHPRSLSGRAVRLPSGRRQESRGDSSPALDTTSRTGKLVMGILALIAEFENDIRRERQMDGIAKAKGRGVKFGRKLQLLPETVEEIQTLRADGMTVPQIMRQTKLSRASIHRALGKSCGQVS